MLCTYMETAPDLSHTGTPELDPGLCCNAAKLVTHALLHKGRRLVVSAAPLGL